MKAGGAHLLRSVFSSAATGFMVYLGLGEPSGRPKCDINTTLFAFLSRANLIESKAATMRWLFVILPSFRGTLKSTLSCAIFFKILY
jgi:hypothetical protein